MDMFNLLVIFFLISVLGVILLPVVSKILLVAIVLFLVISTFNYVRRHYFGGDLSKKDTSSNPEVIDVEYREDIIE